MVKSSEKHAIPRADQVWAMTHPSYQATLPGESVDDGTVMLFIGHPHAQTDRGVEILVNVYSDGRDAVVFHAMELGPKYRKLREEDLHD